MFEYTDDDIIRDQNTQIVALSQDTQQLNEVYQDYAQVMYDQGQQLEVAEQNVQQTQANVDEGVKTLLSTTKSKKYAGLTLGSAIFGSVVGGAAGIVLGPAGIVIGAIGGFAAGGAAGHQTGKAIRHKQERDIVRIQMDSKWVPDENAKNCFHCKKGFTTTRRRHHCRNCGEVFCQKCSKHKIKIPSLNIGKAVRVCKPCYDYVASLPPPTSAEALGVDGYLPDALAMSVVDPNDPHAASASQDYQASSSTSYIDPTTQYYPPPPAP
ncbi:MAG: FYVE zinc finger domain-containing protein [archaeon]|nr:FYVE zinc finger domain-containing protein [archaeon]